eukprot:Skav207424  [mRNA]  locus=scaffold646:285466:286026:- [translate_table: standard]
MHLLNSVRGAYRPDCCIIADMDYMESAATAYILYNILIKELQASSRCASPRVMLEGEHIPHTAEAALMVLSSGCFQSAHVADLLLLVARLPTCSLLPILSDDSFRFPDETFFAQLQLNSPVKGLDIHFYSKIIRVAWTIFLFLWMKLTVFLFPWQPPALTASSSLSAAEVMFKEIAIIFSPLALGL